MSDEETVSLSMDEMEAVPPNTLVVNCPRLDGLEGIFHVETPTDSVSFEKMCQSLLKFENSLDPTIIQFGQHSIHINQTFYETESTLALVNLKPIVPGHVLIIPRRCVSRFHLLDSTEVADLWTTAQFVGQRIEKYYQTNSLTFAMQDGLGAGQTVEHVHVHVLPRRPGDFEPNDKVYDALENTSVTVDAPDERKSRSQQKMQEEATQLRNFLLQ